MTPTRVTLVAHTHWDREWYQPFEVFRARLIEVLDEAIELLERDVRLTFTLDGQVALVEDYLEMRPWMQPRIRALVKAGRLHIGPWFTQADTLLVPGEALVRNLAYGIRRAEPLGGSMRVGYMPDQFGHAAQLPQVLQLFSIDAAVLWRGVGPERPPHAFRWEAPDGRFVTAVWLQEGYATGRHFPSDHEAFATAVERAIERHGPWLGGAPLLIPIGDDHVRLPDWLPDAAEGLRARRPEIVVATGGYAEHLEHVEGIDHTIRGELRSPAFAPVLAGVASARVREKQAAARATTLLLRYAEPLCTWAAIGGIRPPRELLERAWRQLFLNQAHDSAAGCGIDAMHEDVRARYRWVEQIASTVCDQVLSGLGVKSVGDAPRVMAYHPGPRADAVLVEAEIPRSLEEQLIAFGPDGVERPVQILGEVDSKPLFEGEFAAPELAVFVQGMDPATPLFGRYLTELATSADGPGRVRIDVGMGDAPVPAAQMARDQKRVMEMLSSAERFRVIVHGAATTRRVLVKAGPAPEAGLVPIWLHAGAADVAKRAAATDDGGIRAGSLRVTPRADGTVLIVDEESGLAPVIANALVDEGDRGDLYHFDPVAGGAVRAHQARASVVEKGPLRAKLVVEQELHLPVALAPDRKERAQATRLAVITTEITVVAGERRVEFVTTLNNDVLDHRLRAQFELPLVADRVDVDQSLTVIDRPIDAASLGSGVERAALTGPMHQFVDVSDGRSGAAILSRGLPEYEALSTREGTTLSLTLLRSVGWLARGDLSSIDHAAGPMLPTPGAQELGDHRFEYALVLHRGDWDAAGIPAEAQRYVAPPQVFAPGRGAAIEGGRALIDVEPRAVMIQALYPSEIGVVCRVLNASPRPVRARLRPAFPVHDVIEVDPLEERIDGEGSLEVSDGTVAMDLAPWRLRTLVLRYR